MNLNIKMLPAHTAIKKMLLPISFVLLLLFNYSPANAQRVGVTPQMAPPNGPPATPTISGPASATGGTTSTYTAVTGTSGSTFYWSMSSSAGTISSSGATATVHWVTTYTGTAVIYCTASNSYGSSPIGSKSVAVTGTSTPLTAGTLSPSTQTINYNTQPTLTATAMTGGTGPYTYQWTSSTTSSSGPFSVIPGAAATAQSYSPPALSVTTYFQRQDTGTGSSGTGGGGQEEVKTANAMSAGTTGTTTTLPTNVAAVIVNPQLVPGAVSPASQGALSGAPLTNITSAAPTGGNGTYTYQWQSAPDNNTWTNVNSGGTTLVYSPGAANNTIYYRLAVTSNGQTMYSSSSSVLVSDCYTLGTTPTASMNYIITDSFREPGVTSAITDAQIAAMGVCDVNQAIQYVDGLGRSLQTIEVKGSSAGNDVVQPRAYDQYDREINKYLPYTDGTSVAGSYRSNAIAAQSIFYHPSGTTSGSQQANGIINTDAAYSGTNYEPSPLNRPVEQGAPGDSWQLSTSGISGSGHTVKIAYGTNSSEVIMWLINSAANGATGTSNYPAGSLYKTTTTDENGNNSVEYKNMDDLVVCKMVQNGTAYLATYYVYDNLNNLTYVVPPIPSATNSQVTAYPTSFLETDAVFLNYMYGYHYDSRNRIVQKKIPGKGWEFMVYNQLDQVVLSQDAVQRGNNQWMVTKYDAFGRVILTGLWNAGSTIAQSTLQASIYAGSQYDVRDATNNITANPTGYVITSYPALSKILTINYYDTYPTALIPSTVTAPTGAATTTTGLMTATQTTVLNTIYNTTPDMLWKVNYYDNLGRTIQTYAQHYLGGTLSPYNYDVITNTYNFVNQVIGTTRQQYIKNSGNTANVLAVTIANTYIYDQEGRKKQTFEQINGGTNVLLADDEYNEIGQLITKNLHSTNSGSSYLQNNSYAYNERGWLFKINDPTIALSTTKLFAEQLNYNLPAYGATAEYNGNIAEQVYANYNNASGTTAYHTTYTYDALNRLTGGVSSAGNSESPVNYDVLGNITALTRSGVNAAILSYKYTDVNNNSTGNLLQSVTGLSTPKTYIYDGNGNAASDGTNSFTYNMLNLPQTVSSASYNIAYTYDADGTKLRKVSTQISNGVVTTTDYISGIQYKTNSTLIDFIQTEEGRVINTGSNWDYEYTLTDHLGNNRATFDMLSGKTNENDYYPFGYDIPKLVAGTNEYLYNKKELQPELTEYDYGARFYDPVIARWTVVDKLAEADKQINLSPYAYVGNNPVDKTDPDGNCPGPPCGVPKGQGTTASRVLTDGQVANDVADAKKELGQILSGSANIEGNALGVGAGVTVGPVKLKASAGVLHGKASLDEKGNVKLEGSAANAQGEAGFGGQKASGNIDLLKGTATIPLANNAPIKMDGKLVDRSGVANPGSITLENSLNVGGSVNLSIVNLEGSISLYHTAKAAVAVTKVAVDVLMDSL